MEKIETAIGKNYLLSCFPQDLTQSSRVFKRNYSMFRKISLLFFYGCYNLRRLLRLIRCAYRAPFWKPLDRKILFPHSDKTYQYQQVDI